MPKIQSDVKCHATSNLQYDDYCVVIDTFASLLDGKSAYIPKTWQKLESLLTVSGHLCIQDGLKVFTSFLSLHTSTGSILIKPNMVRDEADLVNKSPEYLVTNWSLVVPVLYYSLLSVGRSGRVLIADAPNSDSRMSVLKERFRWNRISEICSSAGYNAIFVDLRKEQYFNSNGVTVSKEPLDGDPEGYVVMDVAEYSEFENSPMNYGLLRGASHDDDDTRKHHSPGKHEYLLSGSVLNADLVINMPKLKTHSKIGITGAVKNMVGINGDKNWLPHWRAGFSEHGGDQYTHISFVNIMKYIATSLSWPLLKYKTPAFLFSRLSRLFHKLGIRRIAGSGAGLQNDTTWRMVLDINKALMYGTTNGKVVEQRNKKLILHIMDAIVAGEGEGPLAVDPLDLGCLIISSDPVRVDILAARLCGLAWQGFSYLEHATTSDRLRITDYSSSDTYVSMDGRILPLDEVTPLKCIRMPNSWQMPTGQYT